MPNSIIISLLEKSNNLFFAHLKLPDIATGTIGIFVFILKIIFVFIFFVWSTFAFL